MLARIGVGYIRVIDGDFVDASNIYRMSLVDEDDVKKHYPRLLFVLRKHAVSITT